MVRVLLRLLGCAGLVLAGAVLVHAGNENEDKVQNALKVQAALSKGSEALELRQYGQAVDALERELTLIGGNRDYLNALRDAYLGLIQELRQKNQPDEAARYERRLRALDPGALLEIKPAGNPPPVQTPAPAPHRRPHPHRCQPQPPRQFRPGRPRLPPCRRNRTCSAMPTAPARTRRGLWWNRRTASLP